MKILLVHNINIYKVDHIGGEEIVFFSELDALEKELGESNIYKYVVLNKDLNRFSLLFNIWFNIKHYFKIKKLIKEKKIDIVHVHNFFPILTPSIFFAAKSAKAKVIQTLHNYRYFCLNGTFFYQGGSCVSCPAKGYINGVRRRCFRNSYLQSLFMTLVFKFYRFIDYDKLIDNYFVLSKIQKNLLSQFGLNKEKLLLKPNFIRDYKIDIKIEEKRDYIYVGRLEYQKGFMFLIDFWKQLPRKYLLKVVGLGELKNLIDEDRWPHIKYLGKLEHEDAIKEIAKSKYLIQPSFMYETFSLTTIEAMSVGTPVISFAYGTRKEFVKNEVNGFIFNIENFLDVIKKSKSFKDYKKLVDGAKKTAKEYSKENIIQKQINYYKNILKK